MSQLFPNNTDFSPEDFIGLLNLTTRSFNALTRGGIQTVGEVAQLVESGELQTIPALGEKSISEIEDKLAQVKILDDSEVESPAKTKDDLATDENDEVVSSDASPLPSDQLGAKELGQIINQAVQQLSPKQQLVFNLRHQDGLKLKEIAAQLDLAEGTIKTHLYKAYKRLETLLIPSQNNDVYLSREDPIEKLNLSRRSFNGLVCTGIRTVGAIIQLVESGGIRTIPALGRKSILEITITLAQVKILDDSEVKSLASSNVHEVLATILDSSLNICEEIEFLLEFLLNQIPRQYRIDILLSTYGLELKTIDQTRGEIDISCKRVSQINGQFKDKLSSGIQAMVEAKSINDIKGQSSLLRMQSALFIARNLGLDITYEGWTQCIRSSGLVGDWTSQEFVGTDAVEVMIAICNLLADCKICWLQMPENLQYAVQLAAEGKPNVPAKILHALETLPDEVERLINGHTKNSGGVHVKWLSQESGIELEDIKTILHWRGYRALSEDWFISNLSQISYYDVFHRCLRKMFQYCGPLAIDDVCSGLRHTLSERKFPVPSPDVMDEIVRIHGYKCEDGLYYWDGRSNENLNESETVIMNCLEQIGPVLNRTELAQAFIESKLSFLSLDGTLKRSPLFEKMAFGLYKLRGREVIYQDIERAQSVGEPQSINPEVEYDMDGNIIVSVTLSAIAMGSGKIFCEQFPDLSGDDWECYVHGEEAGELNATENEFRRLKKPFELLNCHPGDRLKFIFNTWERTVTIERVGADAQG